MKSSIHANAWNDWLETLPLSCRYLAVVSALASGADWVFIPEAPPEEGWEDHMCARLGEVRLGHELLKWSSGMHCCFCSSEIQQNIRVAGGWSSIHIIVIKCLFHSVQRQNWSNSVLKMANCPSEVIKSTIKNMKKTWNTDYFF